MYTMFRAVGAVAYRLRAVARSRGMMRAAASLAFCCVALSLAPCSAEDLEEREARPVEYVKICSLYDEGFYYVPGTDTCVKFGGYVRAEATLNAYSNGRPFYGGTPGSVAPGNNSSTPWGTGAGLLDLSADLRTQTNYGTLRVYFRGGVEGVGGKSIAREGVDGAVGAGLERAFIQFAGFTVGKTPSFYDHLPASYSYAPIAGGYSPDAPGTWAGAYKWEAGSGISATISLEDGFHRRNALWNASLFPMGIGSFPGPNTWGHSYPGACLDQWTSVSSVGLPCLVGDYTNNFFPDVVGNLRVDQAWGSARIAGALHQVRAGFDGAPNRPSDKWGWAIAASVQLNLPSLGDGDRAWITTSFAQGAPSYTGLGQQDGFGTFWRFSGDTVAAGWALDGVFNTPVPFGGVGGFVLPLSFNVAGALEHHWGIEGPIFGFDPTLRTAIFGQYAAWYPTNDGNRIMCASPIGPMRTVAGATADGTMPLPGCDFGFSAFSVGTRTVWNPTRTLDIGAEMMFSRLTTKMDPNQTRFVWLGDAGKPAGLYRPSDQNVWSGLVRIQRNFYP